MSHSLSVGEVGEKHIKITWSSLLFLILDGVSVIKTNPRVSTQKNFRPTNDLLELSLSLSLSRGGKKANRGGNDHEDASHMFVGCGGV